MDFVKLGLETLGNRTNNGKCRFCGRPLQKKEWCDCPKAQSLNRYYRKLNNKIINAERQKLVNVTFAPVTIPIRFEGKTFSDFLTKNQRLLEIKTAVDDYASKSFTNFLFGKNLGLIGNYRTGKTLLMSILVQQFEKDFSCKFINMNDLMQEIKSSFDDNSSTVKSIIAKYSTVDYLFLDDIDKVKPSEYTCEIAYAIVNYRTENELPIIFAANNSLEILDSSYYGEAIMSRLCDVEKSRIIRFNVENWSLKHD